MAEIPEHLLKRAQARRKALEGGGGDEGGEAGPAPAAAAAPADKGPTAAGAAAPPAKAPAAVPATAPQPKAPPELPAGRRRYPAFVLPVFAVLPFFAFLYAQAYQAQPVKGPTDPLVLGAELYRTQGCAGCHGGAGEGGVGPALNGDETELTFPDEAAHAAWIRSGSAPFAGQLYGNPDRPGGQRRASGGMPGFPSLSDEEIEALVLYEREQL